MAGMVPGFSFLLFCVDAHTWAYHRATRRRVGLRIEIGALLILMFTCRLYSSTLRKKSQFLFADSITMRVHDGGTHSSNSIRLNQDKIVAFLYATASFFGSVPTCLTRRATRMRFFLVVFNPSCSQMRVSASSERDDASLLAAII
jgi:hypothetical protein